MTTLITQDLLASFQPSKLLQNHAPNSLITSLSYDQSGQYLISSGIDESIQLYDVTRGKHSKSIYSKKYGCHLAKFTSKDKCIFASTKENDTIRYLSLIDNSFIRYFKGHDEQVIALEVSYSKDIFVSSSLDHTVRIWDTRSSNCQVMCQFENTPDVIGLNPNSTIIAAFNNNSKTISIYPLDKFNEQPIISLNLSPQILSPTSTIIRLEFTNDNRFILLTTINDQFHYVLNASNLKVVATLSKDSQLPERSYPDTGSLTISPDCKYAIGGNGDDGSLSIWDLKSLPITNTTTIDRPFNLVPIKKMENSTKTIPRMVLFNPRFCMLTTADTEVTLWLPK